MSTKSVIFHRTKGGFETFDLAAWDDFAVINAYDLGVSSTPIVSKDINPSHSAGIASKNEMPTTTVIKEEVTSDVGEVVWSRSPGVEVMTQPNDSINKVVRKKKRNNRYARRRKQTSKLQWKVGDSCMALYQEDQLFYKATIKEVHNAEGTVVVSYTDYDEDEVLAIRDVYPENLWTDADKAFENEQNSVSEHLATTSVNSSQTRKSSNRKRQRLTQTNHDSHDHAASTSHQQDDNCSINPPPPFFPTSNGLNINVSAANMNNLSMKTSNLSKDALSSMLVSWYMAGYHTGYYRGLTNSSDQ